MMIGHNNPPADPSPYDLALKAVEDIYAETTQGLDGKAIDSQEAADYVANLLTLIRQAENQADTARVDESAPYRAALTEIQARYHPLIGDTKAGKGKTILAAEACKAALAPWLEAERKRIEAEARQKREEADRLRREAEAALRATAATALAEREAAEALLVVARRAETVANAAERATPTAGGTFGRSAALRTTWHAEISDEVDAARSMWADAVGREEIRTLLLEWANLKVRQGTRSIPGFRIKEDRSVA